MALSVTFVGTSPIPTPGSSASYKIWSYKIEGTVSEISTGLRLALALPDNLNIQDPASSLTYLTWQEHLLHLIQS